MKLRDYSVILIVCFIGLITSAQGKVSGYVTNSDTNDVIQNVEVFDKSTGLLTTSDAKGYFEFTTTKTELTLVFFATEFQILEQIIEVTETTTLNIVLTPLKEELSEVVINARKAKVFELQRLNDVEETAIYAGRKTEVVKVDQSMANLATNNASKSHLQL
ncbi:MAG: carboxypeptidase-like regulatory domain-containing protein [Psychroserpens sp.]|nr:carboxypeptidase-like regulatory domain-containing protein [Psychroserpens sp.]